MADTVEQDGPRRTGGTAEDTTRHWPNSETETDGPVLDTGVCKVQTQPWFLAQGDVLCMKGRVSPRTLLVPRPPVLSIPIRVRNKVGDIHAEGRG